MAKKTDSQLGKIEREYVIPLRAKYKHVPRYKKTPKAIKEIKIFLARHMRIRDRDLNKIKIDKLVNEYMWARGIKNPQYKIKVRAIKDEKTGIVKVELVNLPDKLKYKKLRADKLSQEAQKIADKKKKEKVEQEKTEKKEETAEINTEEKKEEKKPEEKPEEEAVKETEKLENKQQKVEEKHKGEKIEKEDKSVKSKPKRVKKELKL